MEREATRLVCAEGHSFDVARSGYVNLLQPQERRSKQPGDTLEAVAARRRLHDRGISAPLLESIRELLGAQEGEAVLDVGCGEGFYLGSIAGTSRCRGFGLDISTKAVEAAAKRYPECEWVVGNADRAIPYERESFSALLSITGRMNAPEFHRVLRPGGRLLVALASAEDLVELRGRGRDRVERTIETFTGAFEAVRRERSTAKVALDAAGIEDVYRAIYRPRSIPGGVEGNDGPKELTFSLDLLLFRRKTTTGEPD